MRPFLSALTRLAWKGVTNNHYDSNASMKLSQLNFPARGCRGGRHKKRSIAATIRNRIPKCIAQKTASGVNINNLVQIPRRTEQNAHNASEIRFATWNARAVRAKNKSASLCDYIISNQLDILAVTETWLTGSDKDNRVIADIQNTRSIMSTAKGKVVALLSLSAMD